MPKPLLAAATQNSKSAAPVGMSPRPLTELERKLAELREHMSEHGWFYGRARALLEEIAGEVELAANGAAMKQQTAAKAAGNGEWSKGVPR